jgi:hypothetical protein
VHHHHRERNEYHANEDSPQNRKKGLARERGNKTDEPSHKANSGY